MEIKQYDLVLLKDGRCGCVVEINEESNTVDIDVGSSPADWETLCYVPVDDIKQVLRRQNG